MHVNQQTRKDPKESVIVFVLSCVAHKPENTFNYMYQVEAYQFAVI